MQNEARQWAKAEHDTCQGIVLQEREEALAAVARDRDEMDAAQGARIAELRHEVDAALAVVQAEAERRQEEKPMVAQAEADRRLEDKVAIMQAEAERRHADALVAVTADAERRHRDALEVRISKSEAEHSQMVEVMKGDLAAKDAAMRELLAWMADLEGRHRATVSKVVQNSQSEAALERTCMTLQKEIDELKSHGARESTRQRSDANDTIAKLRYASGTLEAQLSDVMAELSDHRQSEGVIATLRSNLVATRQALADAVKNKDAGLSSDQADLAEKNRALDRELRTTVSDAARLRNEVDRLDALVKTMIDSREAGSSLILRQDEAFIAMCKKT